MSVKDYRFTMECQGNTVVIGWDEFPMDLPAEYADTYEDISHSDNISAEMDVLMGAMGPAMSIAAMMSPAVTKVTRGLEQDDVLGQDISMTLTRGDMVLHTMMCNATVHTDPDLGPYVGFDPETLLAEFAEYDDTVDPFTDERFQRRWPQQQTFDQTWVGMSERDKRNIQTIAMTLTQNVIAMFDQGIIDL